MRKLRIIYALFALLAVSCGRDELVENEVQRPVVPGNSPRLLLKVRMVTGGAPRPVPVAGWSSLAVMLPVPVCMMEQLRLLLQRFPIPVINLPVLPEGRWVAILINSVGLINTILILIAKIGDLRSPLRKSTL